MQDINWTGNQTDRHHRCLETITSPVISGPVRNQHRRQRRSERRWLSWSVVLVPVAIVVIGAWSYRWVQEDAFIDFRVIGNLLAGHGPVFNVGERVEVYSDPLWVLLLTVIHEVVLTVIGMPFTLLITAIGPTSTWAAASDRRPATSSALKKSALIPRPPVQ